MDTKTAQKQLVSLITEHLSDSIPVTRILTYKPSANGAVTGRFESSGRVYNFMFNGMEARYKPAMNADSALFSDYYLERFDAVVAPVKGARALPNCTSKSYSCKGDKGVGCVPLTKHCRMGSSAIGNERLGKIKSMSKSLAANGEDTEKVEATRAKIVEGRMAMAVENRAKREPKSLAKAAVGPVKAPTAKKEKVVKPKKEIESKVKPIKDYADFKVKALTAFRDLNEDYDHGNLVPIHQIRDALGSSVSKEDFDKYLMKLQGSDVVQLQARGENSPVTLSKEELNKSVKTAFGDTKTDVKLLDKKALSNLPKRKDQGKSVITQKDFNTNLDKLYSEKKKQNDGLVPIHEIRSALGDKVSKKDFDKWTQENNGYQLITGRVTDLTPEKIKGSIKNELGGMRYYIKKIEPVKKEQSNAKIDLDLDDKEPVITKKSTPTPVNKDTLINNWSKKFEAFEKGDRDRASVDSEEKDEEGTPLLQAYLRKGSYFVNGKTYPKVNQLASIEVSENLRGQGLFSSVIKEIEKRHPDRPIVIEGVSEGSIALAKKNGFTEDTHSVGNWVKMPKK